MPYTLFCHEGAPQDAFAFFNEHNALLEGNEAKWRAGYLFDGPNGEELEITFTYDREHCSPPNWPTQLLGMQRFVAEFEMDDTRRPAVMALIRAFRFCIGIINEPEIEDGEDPRLDVMHALAEQMPGVFFVPGALLDSHFRPFADAGNDVDPEAVIPRVPAETFDEDEDEDEDEEWDPPNAERVAARAYVLTAVAARGLLDMNLVQGNRPAYRLDELQEWLGALGIDDELEPEERQILETPEQQLPQQTVINSVWCLEALAVLAWGLRLTDLPPYDQLVDVDEFLSALGLLNVDKARQHLADAQLRPPDELDRFNEQVWAYNWRMVDFRIRPQAVDYAKVEFGAGPLDLSWAVLDDGDLSLRGTPIAKADGDVVGRATSIAQERHRASNWLCGQARLFSNISTDT